MKHTEKVVVKWEAYKQAGFECTQWSIDGDSSFFFSSKDGIKRKHTFTDGAMAVQTVDSIPDVFVPVYVEPAPVVEVIAPALVEVEEVVVEEAAPEPVVEEVVTEPVVPKAVKKTKKKKG
jgi:hypothetical protein